LKEIATLADVTKPFPLGLLEFRKYTPLRFFSLVVFVVSTAVAAQHLYEFFTVESLSWFSVLLGGAAVRAALWVWYAMWYIVWYSIAWLLYDFRTGVTMIANTFMVLAGLIYVLSPIDIIPDAMPVIGQMDDLTIGGGLIALGVTSIAQRNQRRNQVKALYEALGGESPELLPKLLKMEGFERIDPQAAKITSIQFPTTFSGVLKNKMRVLSGKIASIPFPTTPWKRNSIYAAIGTMIVVVLIWQVSAQQQKTEKAILAGDLAAADQLFYEGDWKSWLPEINEEKLGQAGAVYRVVYRQLFGVDYPNGRAPTDSAEDGRLFFYLTSRIQYCDKNSK
jgi:uncharacterized membrane protein YkvA (DUF1232 family)